jgi:hypothetical protein
VAKLPEADADRLRRENERLRRENRALRQVSVPEAKPKHEEKPKPLRRIFLEAAAGGSLFIAAIGGGYQVTTDLLANEEAICAIAHQAIRDDRLNQDLSANQRKAYVTRQYRIAERCDKDEQ